MELPYLVIGAIMLGYVWKLTYISHYTQNITLIGG
ncbi:hypothetical protein LINPERHAP2_LOCUS250 [Linum perenne]